MCPVFVKRFPINRLYQSGKFGHLPAFFILNFLLGVLFNELILLKNDFLATSLQVNIFFSFLNAFVSKSFFHPIHKP